MDKESRRIFLIKRVLPIALAPFAISCGQFFGSDQKVEEELTQTARVADLEVSPTAALPPQQSATVLEKRRILAEMVDLRDRLGWEIENYPGRTAISITDITGDESIDVNGQRAQLPGCVANLACALTVVAEIASGKASLSKEAIEAHLVKMVRNSDPHAGLKVVYMLGGGDVGQGVLKINKQMKDWGMEGSLYDHPPAYLETYNLQEDNNYFVANELNMVLAKLASLKLFGAGWDEYALWVMANNKVGLNFMIPGEIPENEAAVYHKIGWFYGNPNTINDVGIVEAVGGRFKYSIAAMYENYQTNISEQSLFYGPGFFLRKLSKITYDIFVQKYGRPQRT